MSQLMRFVSMKNVINTLFSILSLVSKLTLLVAKTKHDGEMEERRLKRVMALLMVK